MNTPSMQPDGIGCSACLSCFSCGTCGPSPAAVGGISLVSTSSLGEW
jgi:hypothetical protein